MPRSHWLVFSGGMAFGILVVVGTVLAAKTSVPSPYVPTSEVLDQTTIEDPIRVTAITHDAVESAWAVKDTWALEHGTRILLVPHHLVAAREIASLFAATDGPSVVYVVSPDHFSQGRTALTTTDAPFAFGDDITPGNERAVRSLVDDVPEIRTERAPFEREHGVTGLIPFIQRAWDDVPVVPLMVRIDVTPETRADLARALTDSLRNDPRAILIVTVDFSHDLPADVADFHDVLAEDVVTSLADLETDRVELDSPSALAIGLKAARMLGLGSVTIHAHTNSLVLMQAQIAQDGTSHLLASFAPGPIRNQDTTTLLFLGDIMLDREVRNRMARSDDPLFPFQEIRDSENRFFRGMDAVIANLEGPVTPTRRAPEKSIDFAFDPSVTALLHDIGITAVSQANNHQLDQGRAGADDSRRLLADAGIHAFGDQVRDDAESSLMILDQRGQKTAILGFNVTDNPLDRDAASAALADARRDANHVVVFMHWGNEYQARPSTVQTNLAHWLIDHGADAVLGAHPHWMQSVEIYQNRPIAYSLGNFIFDQDWSTETRQGLVAGLAFLPNHTKLYLFPIQIDQSVPHLLSGDDRRARLDHLADISNPALAEMIRRGIITTTP